MAKNRKNQSAAVRFGPALKALLLCVFIGGSAVGYVWQKKQIFALGRQIEKLEKQLEDQRQKNKERQDQLAYLRSPRVIDERVRELRLGLAAPQPSQIVRVVEVLPEPPAPANNQLLASRQSGASMMNP
ncbi:MAG: septum formation initiator family protein [Verrucomicrobiota bacterium]